MAEALQNVYGATAEYEYLTAGAQLQKSWMNMNSMPRML